MRISDWSSDVCSSDLLVADMDSTMITVECIDELADYAGLKAQIAEVTERAMRGELDFAEALRSRVALLKGLEDEVIDLCRRSEEHTSELQSLMRISSAVFCLKKQKNDY